MSESRIECGNLGVGGGYELYYEVHGASAAPAALFLHGGPGLGCKSHDYNFFDYSNVKVIFFDQRGAGRSAPRGVTEYNTTEHLTNDINLLLEHLRVDKVTLFGGSWGSTLALLYAISSPDRVSGLVLRGTFLADHWSLEHLLSGSIRKYFPKEWERFYRYVKSQNAEETLDFLYNEVVSQDVDRCKKATREWLSFISPLTSIRELMPGELSVNRDMVSQTQIELYYAHHSFFIEDNYILNSSKLIEQQPITFVHGRYDMLCPLERVEKLHKKLPMSTLRVVSAGHAAWEYPMQSALLEELSSMLLRVG